MRSANVMVLVLLAAAVGGGAYFAVVKKEPSVAPGLPTKPTNRRAKKPRIVSLNGTLTETLFALGVGGELVGRDTSSYYPKAALALPAVGYQHRLNAEGILRLKPSLVVGLSDVKPRAVLEQIKSAGVRVLLLKTPNSVALSQAMIRQLGEALGRQEQATGLIAAMDGKLAQLAALRKKRKGKKLKVMALYVRGTRMRFVLGRETTVGGMLELIGAEHAVSFARVKPLSAEAMIAAKPQVLVAFKKGVGSIGGLAHFAKLPGVALTPAGKEKRFVVMDDLLLGGFGPRTGEAALKLFRLVYPSQ